MLGGPRGHLQGGKTSNAGKRGVRQLEKVGAQVCGTRFYVYMKRTEDPVGKKRGNRWIRQ